VRLRVMQRTVLPRPFCPSICLSVYQNACFVTKRKKPVIAPAATTTVTSAQSLYSFRPATSEDILVSEIFSGRHCDTFVDL